jgi:hypothetical protein
MLKIVFSISFLLSLVFVFSKAWVISELSSHFRFLWFLYSVMSFALWQHLPDLVEGRATEARRTRNWILFFPLFVTLASLGASDEKTSISRLIYLLIPMAVFYWLSCIAWFGRKSFSAVIYTFAMNPFSVLFSAKRKGTTKNTKKNRRR